MKRIFFVAFTLVVGLSYGQKKPKINKAEDAWKNGEFAEAKAIVDAGIEHPKTLDDAKTWFIRGLVYASMDTAGVEGGSIEEAMKSFEKAAEIKGENSENIISGDFGFLPQSIVEQQYWAYYLNQGVAAFQESDAAEAVKYFEKSQVVEPDSLDAYYYAGLAAMSIEDYEASKRNFGGYIEKGGEEEDAYIKQMYILSALDKDNEKALEYAQIAKERFPQSKDIADFEFRILFAMDRVDEAVAKLEASAKREPNNAEYQFNLGVIKDQMDKTDESEQHYIKALEIDPDYSSANFNLGVLYRNKLVEIGKKQGDLGFSKADQAKSKELDKEIKKVSEKALPYWEAYLKQEPKDQTALETLQYLYLKLDNMDKVEEIQKKLEEYGYMDEEN